MGRLASEVAETLKEAMQQHDLDTLLGLYDEGAEVRVIDQEHPPSQPLRLFGKRAISEYYRDIFSRPVRHNVEQLVAGETHLAYTESWEYQDGSRVFLSAMLDLHDGKIVREVDVQAWDEMPVGA